MKAQIINDANIVLFQFNKTNLNKENHFSRIHICLDIY